MSQHTKIDPEQLRLNARTLGTTIAGHDGSEIADELDRLRNTVARARQLHYEGKHDEVGVLLVAAYHGFTPPAKLAATTVVSVPPDLAKALADLERAAVAMLDCTDGSERDYLREEAANARAVLARLTHSSQPGS
jgi:hypothetical protein